MKKILKPSQILPSQTFLKPETIKFIIGCLRNNNLNQLPPAPIVRIVDKRYVAIDGHNLIAVYEYLGRDVEVNLADSKVDTIDKDIKSVHDRNKELFDNFDKTPQKLKETQAHNVHSFKDLIQAYKEIFEL